MKKSKTVKILLILSLAAFIALLGYYIYLQQANKHTAVSKREQYQSEYLLNNQEEAE